MLSYTGPRESLLERLHYDVVQAYIDELRLHATQPLVWQKRHRRLLNFMRARVHALYELSHRYPHLLWRRTSRLLARLFSGPEECEQREAGFQRCKASQLHKLESALARELESAEEARR